MGVNKVKICPRCKNFMSEDEDGAWCDECGYEFVTYTSRKAADS